eukprot:TRINITY_DN10706_c0_g4_i3.p1 TRINITY_DN10706_c0_g4~~TRINITY_DN10706_c0_g4_i3.p1  ORF type:complete len:451 (+),score=127.58 TRINITY_DN10706_c0_g4_i3:197-1354(+)
MMDALDAVQNESNRQVNNRTLKVTAAFFNSSEPTRKGWWQCALCRTWNDASIANNVCHGYMCGLKQHDEGIEAYESQLSSIASYEENYFNTSDTMGMMHAEMPQDMQLSQQPGHMLPQQPQHQHSYYPYEYQQPQHPQPQAQPYDGPVQEDPSMHAGMVMSSYLKPNYYSTAYDMQGVPSYHTSYPPTVTPRSGRYAMPNTEPSPEVPVSPPPSSLNSHCVIVSNVPTNITDKTLNKVFMKFAPMPPMSWVKPTQQDTARALAEGQVAFDAPEYAKKAVEGESSREVDNQHIYCTYAEEVFILSVVAEEHDQWNQMFDDNASNEFMNEIGHYFRQYGLVNAILSHERVIFVEYYSLASALDAICGEDGGPVEPDVRRQREQRVHE